MTEGVEAAEVALDAPAAGAAVTRARQAYFAVTLLIAGIVAWGFWDTYYSRISQRTDLPSLVHWHAAVFSAWVLLLMAQAAAVVAGRVRLHRQIGTAGMLYGALVFSVGLVVSVGAPALRVRGGDFPLEVGAVAVLYNLTDILLFGAFLAFAFAYRDRPELHKRWIIAATAALCGAALGRVVPGGTLQYLLLWLSPVLALVAIDVAMRRRVHPVPLVAAALIVVVFFRTTLLSGSVWRDLGGALLRPFV